MEVKKGFWIKRPIDIRNKKVGCYNVNLIYKQGNIYIMDNHLAAAYCWLNELNKKENLNFFHIDQHPDLWRNAPIESYERIKNHTSILLDEFISMSYQRNNELIQCFNYGNYILQIQRLFPNWFKKCCFACPDIIDDKDLIIKYQYDNIQLLGRINDAVEGFSEFKEDKNNRWIINIDLDYFFYHNTLQMLSYEYIHFFCNELREALEKSDKIAIVTIALSPECCGGWDNVIPVANYVAKELGLDFKL